MLNRAASVFLEIKKKKSEPPKVPSYRPFDLKAGEIIKTRKAANDPVSYQPEAMKYGGAATHYEYFRYVKRIGDILLCKRIVRRPWDAEVTELYNETFMLKDWYLRDIVRKEESYDLSGETQPSTGQ